VESPSNERAGERKQHQQGAHRPKRPQHTPGEQNAVRRPGTGRTNPRPARPRS
jgi:hypothetical protein